MLYITENNNIIENNLMVEQFEMVRKGYFTQCLFLVLTEFIVQIFLLILMQEILGKLRYTPIIFAACVLVWKMYQNWKWILFAKISQCFWYKLEENRTKWVSGQIFDTSLQAVIVMGIDGVILMVY